MKNFSSKYSVRTLCKWAGIFFLLLAYLAAAAGISILPLSSRARRLLRVRNTSAFSRLALVLFGVRVHPLHRERAFSRGTGRLLVANHVSYVDVLVLAALKPAVFITSVELKHTVLLGLLAKLAGSLFVERRKPAGLKREIAEIAIVLKQGFTVVLFPEGTTSNGERVHTFKRSLFDAALNAGAAVLPVSLRYMMIEDQPVSARNRDRLFYYGGISFTKHFPRFLSLLSVDVEVEALKQIPAGLYSSRKELASAAHDEIGKAYDRSRQN